jgi:HlyD family secretion protein
MNSHPVTGATRAIPAILALAMAAGALLSGCDVPAMPGMQQPAQARQQATPLTVSTSARESTVAQGKVVPAEAAMVSAPAAGILSEILVNEGDRVTKGQVIARLDATRQKAAIAQAEAQVHVAQAQLADAKAGPRSQEVAVAEAELAAAQAALAKLSEGPDENQLIAQRADVADAQASLSAAQAAYDTVRNAPDIGARPESVRLQQATNLYNAAKARLDALQKPARAADMAAASAEVRHAQAQLDLVKAGSRPESIAVAESQVQVAQASLEQAKAQLTDTELRSPLTGSVVTLNVKPGEYITPGGMVARLADLSAWQVETDDVTEAAVVGISAGQPVTITFDAIRGLTLPGKVVRIKPIGENKKGDMTYTLVIAPDRNDNRLLWNMTATVVIETM